MFIKIDKIEIQLSILKERSENSDKDILAYLYNFDQWQESHILSGSIMHFNNFASFYKEVMDNNTTYRLSNNINQFSVQVTSKYIYLGIETTDINEIPKLLILLNNHLIINEKSIVEGKIKYQANYGHTPTNLEIKKITTTFGPSNLFGFDITWLFIIPPEGHPERKIDAFDDTVLLNAPVYETKKIASGAIMIRLTENMDPYNIDREYIDTFINLQKYLAENIINKEEIIIKEKSYTLALSELNLQLCLHKTPSDNEVSYIASICENIGFTSIFTDDYDEMESLEKNNNEKNKEIINNFLEISHESIELAVYEGQREYQSLFVQKNNTKDRYFYRFNQINKKGRYNHLNMLEDCKLLDDPGIYYGHLVKESSSNPPTLTELTTIYPNQNTYTRFGFNTHWWFIIPPKGHPERPIDPFESDDIFLNAPVYKARRLNSGATLIQLTENYDFLNSENKEYVDTLLRFNEYLNKNIKN